MENFCVLELEIRNRPYDIELFFRQSYFICIEQLTFTRGGKMKDKNYPPLDLKKLKEKQISFLSTKEALKDVTPIAWNAEDRANSSVTPEKLDK